MELVVKLGDGEKNVEVSELLGVYQFDYDENKMKDVEKGDFVFKQKGGNGHIFRNNGGFWSVRVEHYSAVNNFLE